MRKSITRFSLVVAVAFVCNSVTAQTHVGKWNTTSAFPHTKGTPRITVKVTSRDNEFIALTYKLPRVSCRTIKGRSAVKEMEEVILGDAPTTALEGEPCLPVIPVKVIIPAGYTIDTDKIKISRNKKYLLPGVHHIAYGEATFPLIPGEKPRRAKPKAAIYDSDQPFPGKSYDVVGVQKKHGISIAFINLHPITYHPKSGSIYSYENIACLFPLKPAVSTKKIKSPIFPGRFNASTIGVENPRALSTYKTIRPKVRRRDRGICNPADSYRYVLVTSEAIRDASTDVTVHDLIAQKEARGLTATIVTIEDVYANYTGVDNAEKLRNFIIDAYTNWETEFVLLGGDINIIPLRYLNAEGTSIPSDLYYQCLDGTYDDNGNGIYGEPTDGPGGTDVDLMAEVYIGRASAENEEEMSNFVFKTLAYENDAEGEPYLRTALMCGEHLGFGGPAEYADSAMEEIRLGSSNHGYTTVGFASCAAFTTNWLYDSDSPGNSWVKQAIIDSIESNKYSIINHLGHANTDYVMKFYNADADALTNTKFLFAYSQGCIPGDFSSDCIAEHLTTSNRHGMYAVVFNSRYGWGKFNSTDGPSQRFDRQFWDAYFGEYIFNLGAINADSHEDNIWDINGSHIRWCYYETNLLGDPHTVIRGQATGPSLAYSSHTFSDSAGGNNDKLINPGEQIVIRTTLVNVGSDMATGVTANISTSDEYVTIQDNAAAFGDISGAGATKEALDNYVITIDAGCPTPHTVTLDLAIQDDDTGSWTSRFTLQVFTSSQISGTVTTFTGGSPVAGATVNYTGPLSGSLQTDDNGNYMFGVIDGSYDIFVMSSDYLPSDTQSVSVPPNQTGVDFALKRPAIAVTPLSISDTVPVGDSTTANAAVTNNGDAPLHFIITSIDNTVSQIVSAETLYDSTHFVTLTKGQKDTRIGRPVNLGKGGPDNFGYSWKDSDEPGGPHYVWNDISSSGVRMASVSGCDDCYQAQPISFSFPFYGNEFDSIYVSSNGFITFGSGSSLISNYPLPSANAPPNLIDLLHDDLNPGSQGDIYFLDEGNRVTVQFDNVRAYNGSGNYTFQIVLEESGTFTVYYSNLTGDLNGCTVGIQNATKDDGLTVVYNAAYLKDNLAVTFRFTPAWLRTNPVSGIVNPGNTLPLSVTLDGAELLGGVHYGVLSFEHNDPVATNPYMLPCTLYVDGIRRLGVTPDVYDFGNVWVGAYDTAALILENAGDEPTTVSDIASNNPVFSSVTSEPIVVPPFGTHTLDIVCNPSAVGAENGVITITSNAEDNPVLTVDVSGTGTPPPEIAVTPGYFHETLDGGDSVSRVVTVTNTGGDILAFSLAVETASQTALNKTKNIDQDLQKLLAEVQGRFKVKNTLQFSGNSVRNIIYSADGARDGENVLIIRDELPWGYDVNEPLLVSMGATVTVISSSQIQNTDFNSYDLILIPSAQNDTFYSNYHLHKSKFESYLNFGGTLQFHCATFSPTITLPGDVQAVFQTSPANYVVDYSHPVVDSVDSVLTGSSASHNYFTNLVQNTQVIIQDDVSRPTLIEYRFGSGTVIATGMTWEFYYPDGLGNPLLPNVMAYTLAGAASSRWLSLDIADTTLVPGGVIDITALFKAENLVAGDYFGKILISHNAPGTVSPYEIPCTLSVNGFRSISVTPLQYDFGNVWVGLEDSVTLILTNNGNEATAISSITSNNPEFSTNAVPPFSVPPFESISCDAIFAPIDVGGENGTLTITSNAEDNPVLTVELTGAGTPPPEIAISPDHFHETLDGGDSSTQIMTISNTGGDDLEYSISTSEDVNDSLIIGYWTFNEGSGDSAYDLSDNGNHFRLLNGVSWVNGLNGTAVEFDGIDDMGICVHKPCQAGMTALTIEAVIWLERYPDTLDWGPIVNKWGPGSSYDDAWGLDIDMYPPRGLHSVVVGNSTVHLNSATPIPLQTWVHVVAVWEGSEMAFYINGVKTDSGTVTDIGSIQNAVTELRLGHNVSLHYYEGKIDQLALYKSAISADVISARFNSLFKSKSHYGMSWLTANPSQGIITPGGYEDITLSFNTTNLLSGTYPCSLFVHHNAPGSVNPSYIPCTLSVNGYKRLSASPASHNFGNCWVGLSDTTTITLINAGNEATTVSSITSDNAEFNYTATVPFTVPAFGTVTFSALFTPIDIGAEAGTITVLSDADDNPTVTVELTGSGTLPPGIAVSPGHFHESLDAGDSITRIMTIDNPGGDILDFEISFQDVEDYTLFRQFDNSNRSVFVDIEDSGGGLSYEFEGINHVNAANLPLNDITRNTYGKPLSAPLSVLLLGNDVEGNTWIQENFQLNIPDIEIDTMDITNQVPTLEYLQSFDIVLLYRNTGFNNQVNVGDRLHEYVMAGGNLVIGTFYWQGRTREGWGLLESIDPLYGGTCDYTAGQLDTQTIVPHPLTENVQNFSAGIYRGGSNVVREDATVVAWWNDGDPFIAFNQPNGIITMITVYPLHPFHGGITGDFYQIWENALKWTAGPKPNWISAVPDTGHVIPGTPLSINVTFNASDLIGGTYVTLMTITHNGPDTTSPHIVPCTLNVDGYRRLSVTPQSYDFGNVRAGLSDSTVITLTNSGDEATTVQTIASDNPVFSYNVSVPFTVPPFDSVSFNAVFSPLNPGMESGLLTITSDAEDNPVLTIDFQGTGIMPPHIAVSPLSFTKRLPEGGMTFDILTIINTGGDNLVYALADSTGYWPIWLQPSDTSGIVLPAETDTIEFTFDATNLSQGIYNALLVVSHNVPGTTPVEIPVTLFVGNAVAGTSRVMYIGPAASTSAQGMTYTMEEIIIGSPTSGNTKGNRYQLKLK